MNAGITDEVMYEMNQHCRQHSIPEDRNRQNHEKKILDKTTLKEIDEGQTKRHPSPPNNQEI